MKILALACAIAGSLVAALPAAAGPMLDLREPAPRATPRASAILPQGHVAPGAQAPLAAAMRLSISEVAALSPESQEMLRSFAIPSRPSDAAGTEPRSDP